MNQNDKIQQHIAKRFKIVKKIGCGAYGIVWKVMEKRTQQFYALKKNFDAFQNSTDAQRTYRQIMYLKKFKHQNIIKPIEVIHSTNEKDIYILFQYMDVDLYTLIRQNILGSHHKKYIIYQVAKALHYLHSAGLIHRDIKPSNILINQDCLAKICDFGLVRSIKDGQQQLPLILTEYIATRWYRAPEILLGSTKYQKSADVWSFGCLLGEITTGRPLFEGQSTLNQIEKVITWTGPPTLQDLKALKTEFGKQMLNILSKIRPKNRKQWLQNCSSDTLDLIEKILLFNPKKRLTMLDVLRHPYFKEFYFEKQIKQQQEIITIQTDDNTKLTIKEYKTLINNMVQEDEKKYRQLAGSTENEVNRPQKLVQNDFQNKTVYRNRFGKSYARSNSKHKQQSDTKIFQKQINSVVLRNKYQCVLGKVKKENRQQKKSVKTDQIEQKRQISSKRKKSDSIGLINTSDKKKQSIPAFQVKKNLDLIAKYMLQHHKY